MNLPTLWLYTDILCARMDAISSKWIKTERKDDHKATSKNF